MKQRLIDANELRKNLSSRYMNELYPDWRTLPELTRMRIEMLAKEFRFAIDHAPTVDAVEVVHGRWVYDRPNHYKCSECNAMWSGVVRFMKFCPDCGAKMGDQADAD